MKKPLLISVLAGIAVAAALAAAGVAFASAGEPMMYATSAAVKTYATAEDFLRNEGASCQVATDGCNVMSVENGQFGASTMRYCFAPSTGWSCTKYSGQLSLDDQAKYDDLRAHADATVLRAVNGFMLQFDAVAARITAAQKAALVTKVAQRAEAVIDTLFNRYPQDTVLASRTYAALKLVSLEMGRVR